MEIVPVDKIPDAKDFGLNSDCLKIANELKSEILKFLDNKEVAGIHVVQLGMPLNLFAINFADKEYQKDWRFFVNCDYEGNSIRTESVEKCLSLPSKEYKLFRYEAARVTGYEITPTEFKPLDQVFIGYFAVVFQHEIDHGYGILISDCGEECQTEQS